ncbi:MAG: hypothetical protein SGJ01_06175 [Gemmatimonadota bacterium]|nr:hypothetical protein [Gemmatimonadota bacterium]
MGGATYPTALDGTYRLHVTLFGTAPGPRCIVLWALSYGVPGTHAAVARGPVLYFSPGVPTDSARVDLALPLP